MKYLIVRVVLASKYWLFINCPEETSSFHDTSKDLCECDDKNTERHSEGFGKIVNEGAREDFDEIVDEDVDKNGAVLMK
ncbi:hypothetical protein VNO80_29905 [Phaseolus coccineus]|uniref:Uncharacterized protein n=1 Tax=Phaseolus coccineus TaxID=3886 RepID=A0AAN9QFI1_PHACN